MPVWLWILLGIVGFSAVSLVVGLALAAILANIGREVSGLIELEPFESWPVTDLAESTSSAERVVGSRSTGSRLE